MTQTRTKTHTGASVIGACSAIVGLAAGTIGLQYLSTSADLVTFVALIAASILMFVLWLVCAAPLMVRYAAWTKVRKRNPDDLETTKLHARVMEISYRAASMILILVFAGFYFAPQHAVVDVDTDTFPSLAIWAVIAVASLESCVFAWLTSRRARS